MNKGNLHPSVSTSSLYFLRLVGLIVGETSCCHRVQNDGDLFQVGGLEGFPQSLSSGKWDPLWYLQYAESKLQKDGPWLLRHPLHPSDINNHRPWILKETCLKTENLWTGRGYDPSSAILAQTGRRFWNKVGLFCQLCQLLYWFSLLPNDNHHHHHQREQLESV